MLKRWLLFGLNADQEERYRRAYLGADAAHARISVLLLLVPMVGFAVNDYGFFGLSWRFYGVAALRLGFLLYSIALLNWLRRFTSYRSYDRAAFAWGLILAVLTVTIHATRPPTFIAHAIIAVVIVFAMVLAIPNRFVNQLLLAVAYTAGETLVIAPGLWRSRQAGVTVLLSMFVANTIAIACAWQLHAWRRREFLAREEERNAKAEAEKQLAERQQAEEALRGSEQRFHSLFDQMTEGFALHEIILDKQGVPCDYRFLEVNPAFEQLTGLNRDEVLEKTLSQVLPNDDPKWVRIYGEVALTGKAVHFNNYSPVLKQHYDVLAYCPTPGRFAVLFTDITDRKRAEEALLRSEKLASVGRMAATIAHEINNPLESVMSLLFLIKENKELPESASQCLEIADGELKRIAHITRQSLGFYRESNAPAVTSVNAVLESAVDLLKSKIKAKHAVIEKQWDGDVQLTAVGGELRQVFSNLLSNSLDAIDANGTIKLRVSSGAALKNRHRFIRVTVADNGKGISASSRQHIFEPFFTTKGTVGTGLGLWVSKQIVDKHGGTIRMRSSNNGARRGTVFSVVLPVEPAAKAHSQSAGT
jgi:PAS domain S-box-containing protein